MRDCRPPRPAVRLLESRLPAHERDELIGDLEEEFRERAARQGRRVAVAWYWTHALALILQRRRLARAARPGGEAARWRPFADAGVDWRHARRSLLRSPGFAVIALLSMTLSLGLATAVFSIINTVLLRPVPVPTADRLVRLGMVTPGVDARRGARVTAVGSLPPPPSLRDLVVGAWLARRQALEALATYEVSSYTAALDGDMLRTGIAMVGPEFFDVFPVRPIAGRTLAGADANRSAPQVAVISERLTRQRFADPTLVIGRTLTVGERPYEIAGVLPLAFEWPTPVADIWIPDRTVWPTPDSPRNFGRSTLALGLLRPGRTIADVAREGQQIADEIDELSREPLATGKPRVVVHLLAEELLAPVWPALVLLMLGTFGVVVAAHVNLAGFLMARNTARRQELGVRRALGASTWRIVRPLFLEQVLLAAAGAVGAMLVGYWALRALPAVAPPDLPRLSDVTLDRTALAFTWASAALTAVIVGLAPARRLPGASLRDLTAEGSAAVAGTGRAAERRRSMLVVAQIAVATLLLVGTVLVGRSLRTMLAIDPGYDPEGVLTFQVGLPMTPAPAGRVWDFYTTLQARLRAQPGVASVGLSNALPLHGDMLFSTFVIPGVTPPVAPGSPAPMAHMEAISPTYLQTIGATLTRGRFFSDADEARGDSVAIVNETFVRTFLPDVDPIGQVVPRGVRAPAIVGVIAPVKRAAATVDADAAFYTLLTPRQEVLMALRTGVALRTTGDPMALAPVVRTLVRELAPGAPVHNLMALETRVSRTFAQPRFFAVALALFAVLALATAVVGVYGGLAASVELRRRELGVRRALGATTAEVARLVMRRAFTLAAIGLAVGSLAAALVAAAAQSSLYGVAPLDAASYAGAAAVILTVVLAAAWGPMRRAVRLDPARVLRID